MGLSQTFGHHDGLGLELACTALEHGVNALPQGSGVFCQGKRESIRSFTGTSSTPSVALICIPLADILEEIMVRP